MQKTFRKLMLGLAAGLAFATTAAIVLTPAAAIAAPATATAPVNVRSGPGPSYGVVDQLQRGQRVDVGRCAGSWCEIDYDGGDGWVSANYLSRGGSSSGNPDVGFGISVGPGGVSVGIGVGNSPRPPIRPPVVDAGFGEVCFYERTRYRGASFCIEEGESIRNLGSWAYRIASIENPDGLSVRVCTNTSLRGSCRTYTSSSSSLGAFANEIASVQAD